jgi:adenylate cyclase
MKSPAPTQEILQIVKPDVVATILFCDLTGYAQFAVGATPEELVRQLNSYMTEVSETLKEHNGTIAKFIGDALFAYWLAEEHPDHASLACAFTSSIHARVAPILKDASTRIGIHTGEVALARINHGTGQTLEPMGAAVNTASRLNGVCALYNVRAIASESVILQAKEVSEWKNLGPVMIKGKIERLSLYGLS